MPEPTLTEMQQELAKHSSDLQADVERLGTWNSDMKQFPTLDDVLLLVVYVESSLERMTEVASNMDTLLRRIITGEKFN
jgi:hypothetical protein